MVGVVWNGRGAAAANRNTMNGSVVQSSERIGFFSMPELRNGRRAGWRFRCPEVCRALSAGGISAETRRAMPDATIHAIGELTEKLGPVLYRASLPNGKPILAHLSKPLADAAASFQQGARVVLELTPYDFDSARILGAEEENGGPRSSGPVPET
jgi:translation initiation factor IF-1